MVSGLSFLSMALGSVSRVLRQDLVFSSMAFGVLFLEYGVGHIFVLECGVCCCSSMASGFLFSSMASGFGAGVWCQALSSRVWRLVFLFSSMASRVLFVSSMASGVVFLKYGDWCFFVF